MIRIVCETPEGWAWSVDDDDAVYSGICASEQEARAAGDAMAASLRPSEAEDLRARLAAAEAALKQAREDARAAGDAMVDGGAMGRWGDGIGLYVNATPNDGANQYDIWHNGGPGGPMLATQSREAADTICSAINELLALRAETEADLAAARADLRARLAAAEAALADAQAELAQTRAVCPTCGPVTACDEDRCCATCGADLIIVFDVASAEVLADALATAQAERAEAVDRARAEGEATGIARAVAVVEARAVDREAQIGVAAAAGGAVDAVALKAAELRAVAEAIRRGLGAQR